MIFGIYIEGAIWSYDTHKLTDAKPKELYSIMPCFLLLPRQHRVQSEVGIYEVGTQATCHCL